MHFLSGRHGDNTKGDARGATEWSPDVSKCLALPLVVVSIHVILLHTLQGMSVVTSLINFTYFFLIGIQRAVRSHQ